jgi:hypothetical protein
MVLRLCLDLNVFFSEQLTQIKRVYPSAASDLVGWVDSGICPAGPVQLIISWPMVEQWANVLMRHFSVPKLDAETLANSLAILALEGPVSEAPHIVLGAGFIPFATEQEMRIATKGLQDRTAKAIGYIPIYDEIEDDRIVYLTALAARADILVTDNIKDFRRAKFFEFEREDLIIICHGELEVVVAKPFFVAHWLRSGVIPDARFIRSRPEEFTIKERDANSTPGIN